MGRLNDEIIDELDQEGPRLEFVSLEDEQHERLKFVGLSFDSLPGCRCRARVELERKAGRTTVATAEGPDSGSGKLRTAALATIEAITLAVDADPGAFELLDIKPVKVFDVTAVIVAVGVRYDRTEDRLVGFCVIDEARPLHAAPLAVLNGTNRFLGAVLVERISWAKAGVLHR